MNDYREHPSVVAHWSDNQLKPLNEASTADTTVWFPLPEENSGARIWEGINGRTEPGGEVTVLGVPAYVYDLNFGDTVNVVRSQEGPLVATGILLDGGNFTFRVLLTDPPEPDDRWRIIAEEFARMGCLVDAISERFIALSCAPGLAQRAADRLQDLNADGALDYETGRTRDPNRS
ncbi:DUF4265 domain-containing protein [Arthrobacter sp. 35W]|uniref:DUF4265 domain-containing protein n=1 Tax=Arthrobacter sp. 35W TaxID=1132441 RepID=UPI0009DF3801|nr:DUF4265 domain-containing protein [Arthrobacter sp. 35W]